MLRMKEKKYYITALCIVCGILGYGVARYSGARNSLIPVSMKPAVSQAEAQLRDADLYTLRWYWDRIDSDRLEKLNYAVGLGRIERESLQASPFAIMGGLVKYAEERPRLITLAVTPNAGPIQIELIAYSHDGEELWIIHECSERQYGSGIVAPFGFSVESMPWDELRRIAVKRNGRYEIQAPLGELIRIPVPVTYEELFLRVTDSKGMSSNAVRVVELDGGYHRRDKETVLGTVVDESEEN